MKAEAARRPWRALSGTLGVVVFGVAFFVTNALQAPPPAAEFDNVEALGPGAHIVAIFMASSTCGASWGARWVPRRS